MSAKDSDLVGVESSPNAVFLPGLDGVGGATHEDWTICTKGFGSLDGLFSDFPVWNVLREKQVRHGLAGDSADTFDGEHEFAVRMSVVKHNLSLGGK